MEKASTGTRRTITVVLVSKAAKDLERACARAQLTEVDVVNRAISLYELVDDELDSGAELLIRRRDGSTYLLELV